MSLNFVTDFGDQAVILPIAAIALLGLLALCWWRAAAAWAVLVPATLGAVLLLKMWTIACREMVPDMGLLSPSGHTAAAAVVYGGMLALALSGLARSRLALGLACGAAGALVVGYTRLALGVHTLTDVLTGGVLGTLATAALAVLAGARPPRPRAWAGPASVVLLVAVLGAAALFHGRRMHAEMQIGFAAARVWPFSACAAAD